MIRSLAPVWDRRARVLILGSMPGAESLRQQHYYAHPRNAFWPLAAALLGFDGAQPYAQRLNNLRARGVALWDVLAACERPGSLDSRIDPASEVPNPVIELLQALDEPRALLLNGRKAEASFHRFLAPEVRRYWPTLAIHVLPSTSPAHAAMSRVDKQAAWSRMLAYLDKPKKEASAMAKKKTAANKAKPKSAKPAKAVKKAAARSRKPAAKKAPARKKIAKPANAGKTKASQTASPSPKTTAKKLSSAARKPLAKKKPATKRTKTVAKAPARVPAKTKKKVAAVTGKAAAPAQAPKKNQMPPRPVVPAKTKPIAQAAKPTKPPKPPRPPKAPPKPKPPRRPRKPTVVAGELVEVSLFKQPLRVPEPWQFGGIAPHEHLHDHGVKAQPDAERLAGKSRKVH